jgi:hypothetical protein
MATAVWITLCKQANDLTGVTLGQTCPQAQRIQFQTTLEVLTSNVTTTVAACTATTTGGVTTSPAPFDYAYASSIWTMAFTFVVGLYMVSKKAGLVLDFIKRA